MNKLIIIEGADGTGKSTLARELQESTKGHLIHGSWNKNWDIPEYHQEMYAAALTLLEFQPVIIDRWAVSEEVYANAYRGGAKYSADEWMKQHMSPERFDEAIFIYCENENAIANHEANKQVREELFDDVEPVVQAYEKYMANTAIRWHRYDFNKVDMKEFVREILQ